MTAAHLFRRQVDGGFAVVAPDEAVAVAVAFDNSLDFAQQSRGRGLEFVFSLMI
jgi:hypothetical protein